MEFDGDTRTESDEDFMGSDSLDESGGLGRKPRGVGGRKSSGSGGGGPGRKSGGGSRGRSKVAELVESGTAGDDELTEMARETLLRVLAAAPKSRAELAAALSRKGYPERVADHVLDRFEDVGLINDAEYAGMLVRTRHGERGLARRAIAQELRRRGIDEETAATALDGVEDTEDEAAARIAQTRLARTRGLDRDVRIRRVVSALARKGYSPGMAFEIVQRELNCEAQELE